MILNDDQALTNMLLIDELGLWDVFDSKSIDDDKTKRYYQLIDDLLDSQIGESIAWLQSDEAEEYFFEQVEAQKEIFDALEDSWDTIFDGHYEKVDDLLDAIYEEGKKKGYSNIKETLNYTDADIQAIRLAKDYNYDLIRSLSDDLRGTVKNKILQGIIMGENPYNLSRTLTKAGVTKLDGSPFTARQRATMIAKTETSRMQNTGMLQSYVNEGYTEVKILTAEDSDVCTTCLEYAYKFNKDEPRVYSPELLKREKVHDIVALIKGGKFPPFHPVCRCTYLTVWETKTDAPDNPPVINLTPVSAEVRRRESSLPEPTKEQLLKNLRPGEREKYESYKKNIPKQKEWLKNNPDAPAEEIAKHQKRLAFLEKKFNELKKKALGADANIPVNKPKAKPKKPVETPKPETPKVDSPTDKPKKKPEEKPVEAKPQNKPTNVNLNETLSDLRKDLPITDEAFDEILKWSKKRVKNKTRYGREYNTNTGEFHPLESKGNEYVLQFRTRDSPEVMRITTMSKGHQGPPGSTDFKLARASENQDFLFISDKEVWYIHTPENFGISSVNNGQNDLMAVYRKANQDASKKVYDLIKEGKLSRNNRAALSEAQDKFLGENLLKELNSKEWQDKGFVVRRAERDDIKTRKISSSEPKTNTKKTVDTTKIDKSKLTYDNIKTPEEVAAYYDLEYIPEFNDKGKIVSQKFVDHMSYVDPKTGKTINHKMEINFDQTFVGPNRRKAKNLIDTTNSGQCKYDQKELIRIVKEAPEVYKFATSEINFTGVNRYSNKRFASNELGNAAPYRSYEMKNGKYYLKGVNSIMMPYLPLQVNHGKRGTVRQTLYHEMSHCIDYSMMKGEARDLLVKGINSGLSRNELITLNQYLNAGYGHGISNDKSWKDTKKYERDYQGKNNYPQEGASWYGTNYNDSEHWAETGSMAAISLTGDLSDAVMEDYSHNDVAFDIWSKYHNPTLDYAIDRIKSIVPTDFSYQSNVDKKGKSKKG